MEASGASMDRSARSSVHILVVDDDPTVLGVLGEALSRSGYQIATARNAFDGLKLLKAKMFHMLIADISMPEMSGIELMEIASRIHPDMPIALITGFGDVDMAKSCLQEGASDFITKPVNIRELPIIVERNLERRRLEAERLLEKGAQILLEAIRALAAAIDAKDSYTAGHSHRVTELSLLLGDSLDLAPEERYTLQLAAEMHDVGKIGIPERLLNKPSDLTEEEWAHVREHPIKGGEIVSHIHELEEVASIIRHHHERIDGLGYPDGLKGDAISKLARIIAIADAYDIMTTGRTYCPKRSEEEAIAEMLREKGRQFDPQMVEAFVRSLQVREELRLSLEEEGDPRRKDSP
jgi:putative two-component system response regulator